MHVGIKCSLVLSDTISEDLELSPTIYALEVARGEDRNEYPGLADSLGKAARPRIADPQLVHVSIANPCLVTSEIIMHGRNKIVEQLVQKVCGLSQRAGTLAVAAVGASVAEEEREAHVCLAPRERGTSN
jgi:hypothetical protein